VALKPLSKVVLEPVQLNASGAAPWGPKWGLIAFGAGTPRAIEPTGPGTTRIAA